jgi:5-methylcytosine-specific restriction endonuclease McrA
MSVCTAQRAFLLIYLNKAEMLNSASDQFLRTVSISYPMPSVIRIHNYITVPYRGVVMTRHNIFKRDNHECQYCGLGKDLTLDHVIPRSKGGRSTWKNLVTACKTCNASKGDYSPEEAGMQLANQPYKPSYVMFIRESSGFVQDEWRPYLEQISA